MDKIRRDKYKSARGGSTQIMVISCANCSNNVMKYQKDGPGNLFRLYLDRIIDENNSMNINSVQEKSQMKALLCTKCGTLLGMPMVYQLENRLAYRLVRGSVHKIKI